MRTFSNFAVSFTIISILSGCLTLFYFAMNTGGPAVMTIGWLIVGFFVTLVALGMAEVASSYPTAGGLYYWAAKLAPSNPAEAKRILNQMRNVVNEAQVDKAAIAPLRAVLSTRIKDLDIREKQFEV